MTQARPQRLQFVESIRFVAGALVVVQHFTEIHREVALFDAIAHLGPGVMGVMLFFLVSGYVVPMSVRGDGLVLAPFFLRRLFRIYPLMLVALALATVLGASRILPHWSFAAAAGGQVWLANLLLIQEYVGVRPILGVTWTLSLEFVWYGLFALSVRQWGDRAGPRLAVIVPVALLALTVLSVGLGIRLPMGRLNLIYACVWGYQAYRHEQGRLSRDGLIRQTALFSAVMLAGNLVAFGAFRHHAVGIGHMVLSATLCPLLFLAIVVLPRLRTAPLLNRGAVPAIGAASFSIYLLHPLAIALGERVAEQAGGGWAASLAVSLLALAVLATAGYRLVEKPGIALGRRLSARFEPRPAPSNALPTA